MMQICERSVEMTIKEFFNELINKKWNSEDIIWLILMIVIASTLTTPLFGIPLGLVAYFFLFYKNDDVDNKK